MSDSCQLSDQFLYQSSISPEPVVKVSSSKRVVYVTDGNNSSYSSGLVSIDATNQLNGSTGFGSLRDAYLTIPYVVTLQNSHASVALTAPANRYCVAPKCNIANVIDSLSVQLNGKEIITQNDYKLLWNNLRAQTEWTTSEIEKHGADSFMYPDSWQSVAWSAATDGTESGDGYVNNTTNTTQVIGLTATGSSLNCNSGFVNRVLSNPPAVAATTNGWPTLHSNVSATIAQQQGRGAFVAGSAATAGSTLGTWYYMLKIRLVDLHPIFKELDLMANPQIRLTLKVNQGYSDITVANAKMKLASTTMISGNTCPVMVASGLSGNTMNAVITGNTTASSMRLAFGVLQNAITPNSAVGAYYPYTTTRLHIPFYDLVNPSAIVARPLKTCRYLDCYAQYFKARSGTGVQTSQQSASFAFQLSASLKNVKYIALIPFAETSSGNYTTATNVEQFASPFDSAPWTHQPGSSIRSFQVQIGNQNVFTKSHDYDFEQFNDEFAKLAAINGDFGTSISNGLIDLQKWSSVQRVLIADCSRITNRDVPQSIQISGVNASCQGSNLLALVVYERDMEINRLTGEVERTD